MAQSVLKLANAPASMTRTTPARSLKAKRKAEAKLKAAVKHVARDERSSDLGTPELKKRMHVVTEVRNRSSTGHAISHGGRVVNQTPLDRYFLHKELDKADPTRNYLLFKAGEQLRIDFYDSGLQAHSSSSFEPRIASGNYDMTRNIRVDALRSYKKAMAKIPETMRPIIVDVLLSDGVASAWASRNGHNKDAGIVILRLALAELADHYGLMKIKSGPG